MAADLYTDLLNIPPGARPPNHYQILSIRLFEWDTRCIHTAVLKQTARLRKWALDPDPERSARIQGMLNEVNRAGAVLEDPQAKTDYDQTLASRMGIPVPEREIAPAPTPISPIRLDTKPSAGRICPWCGARMGSRDIYCLACGYDTNEDRDAETRPVILKRPRRKKKRFFRLPRLPQISGRNMVLLASGTIVVVALLLLGILVNPAPKPKPPEPAPGKRESPEPPRPPRERQAKPPPSPPARARAKKPPSAAIPPSRRPTPRPARKPATLPVGWVANSRQVETVERQGKRRKRITYYRNTIGMDLVRIPDGTFMMGDDLTPEQAVRRWPWEDVPSCKALGPRHRVHIAGPFYMGACEVTCGQFARFVRETHYKTEAERVGNAWTILAGKGGYQEGANWRNPFFNQSSRHPVVCVSWNDAKAFCRWLSRKENLTYRLPTEAEWEYAARAGSGGIWYWGDDESGAQGCANVAGHGEDCNWRHKFEGVTDGFTYTAPVARFAPNAFGLYDMIGNVWEWCEDWFSLEYYANSPRESPPGPPTGERRMVRGGSWTYGPSGARSASRGIRAPGDRVAAVGFRIVCRPR